MKFTLKVFLVLTILVPRPLTSFSALYIICAAENSTSVSHVPRLLLVEVMSLGTRLHKHRNEPGYKATQV